MAGLTEAGLVIKRQPEVLADIVLAEQTNIDPDISTRDDELLGQLNNIISLAEADQWALAQAVNDNFNPLKAEGSNLDDVGVLISVPRQAGAKSTTTGQLFVGENGSTVPSGTILSNPITLDRFDVVNSIAISVNSCVSAKYSVATLLDTTVYTLSVNATEYTYASDGSATALEILNGIKADIDLDVDATWTATVDTPNEQLEIATSDTSNITIITITYLIADEVTVSGSVESQEVGAINAPPNSVTGIVTGASGLTSSTNPAAYIAGRLRESDELYRARILISQQTGGKATVEAITDDVSVVAGVTTVVVTENDQITVDGDGRPPKSFETVVQGGLAADVALAIWISKPAGIETYGNTSTNIDDKYGNEHTINYTRPVAINLAFLVEYTKYSEEIFPVDGEATIAGTVQTITDALGLDEDVIPSRYFGPIYSAVAGIDSLVVSVQQITTPGDAPLPGSWQTTKLAIGAAEFGSTTSPDITVDEV